MCSSWKVWSVAMMVVLLATPGLSAPKYFRPFGYFPSIFGRFPKRDELQYPLPGLLPRDTDELWNGYDEEGFSRNGRDLSYQIPDITYGLAM